MVLWPEKDQIRPPIILQTKVHSDCLPLVFLQSYTHVIQFIGEIVEILSDPIAALNALKH